MDKTRDISRRSANLSDALATVSRMNSQPFVGTEALAAGAFTRRTLASRNNVIFRNVYIAGGGGLALVGA